MRSLKAETSADLVMLTAFGDTPGRIVRDSNGRIERIVEAQDASPEELALEERNTGMYLFSSKLLWAGLGKIDSCNSQGEFYLTDVVGYAVESGHRVEALRVEDPEECLGINDRSQLAEATRVMRRRINEELMAAGVTIEDPATTYVDVDVTVGPDTVMHPGVFLEGRTTVGARCELHAGVRIVDSTLADDVLVNNHCVIQHTRIAEGARVGPFAHLREGTVVGAEAKIGNFVETKKTSLGRGSKANHLTYLGDTSVGDGANVGAGTITCNYDGVNKHATAIGHNAFIGSGTQLVAPVSVGDGAYVGAGSCITEDVPAGALSVARSRQLNKTEWASRRRDDENS